MRLRGYRNHRRSLRRPELELDHQRRSQPADRVTRLPQCCFGESAGWGLPRLYRTEEEQAHLHRGFEHDLPTRFAR